MWPSAEIVPVLLLDIHTVVLRGLVDVGEGLLTLVVGDSLHLIETRYRIPDG